MPALQSNETLSRWGRALRLHQWLKNILLFVPLLASHSFTSLPGWMVLGLAFVSFSLCASAIYIVNDLLDIESDRAHPRKCKRPFAAGELTPAAGMTVAAALLSASAVLAALVGGGFWPWLAFYFLLTCAYSFGLKRVILLDTLVLAVLYCLRIVAGSGALGQELSFWLLAFGVFLFLSLAYVKRYAELQVQNGSPGKVTGRGYVAGDAPLVQIMGVASGYAAALVLAFYINSDAVARLYDFPEFVWCGVPVLLYWISWMWLQAHRGRMHDDPLVFAVKDRASLIAGAAFAAILAVGAMGPPW